MKEIEEMTGDKGLRNLLQKRKLATKEYRTDTLAAPEALDIYYTCQVLNGCFDRLEL